MMLHPDDVAFVVGTCAGTCKIGLKNGAELESPLHAGAVIWAIIEMRNNPGPSQVNV